MPNQQLGQPCLSLSSPCSASMSRTTNTSLLKGREWVGGGNGASAKMMGKLSNIRRGCKHVRGKDTNWALLLNYEHTKREIINEHVPKTSIPVDGNASKQLKTKNELTHITNKNCTSPSSRSSRYKHSKWIHYTWIPWWRTCRYARNVHGRVKNTWMQDARSKTRIKLDKN